MEISLALILDELGFDAKTHLHGDPNPKFSSAELYEPGAQGFSSEKLLVCTLDEAVAAEKRSGAYFLCVPPQGAQYAETPQSQPRGAQSAETPQSSPQGAQQQNGSEALSDVLYSEAPLEGVTIVNANIGLRELYNRVNRIFVRTAEWIMAMERSVASHSGLQELLDLSEPVFGNFITIQDSTFKLVAYTKNVAPSSVVMSRLVQYGFQPPETMELFRRYRRLEEYKTITDVVVSRDRITSDFDVVKKTFHLGGSMFIIVVMECNKKPADNATVELFGMLIEYIKAYADLDIAQTGGVAGVKALAVDILDRNTSGKEETRVRSAYCGYPFDAGFRLYVFNFEDEDNVPIAQFIQHLTEACRDSVAFYKSQQILMIELRRAEIPDTCDSAAKALNGSEFACGISNDFDELWDLPGAYEQATVALNLMKQLKAVVPGVTESRFQHFSDSLLYHIVSAGRAAAPGVFDNSLLVKSISVLRKYDSQHHTETARMLRLYLENERSATTVASLMHMHRNTVLYHMERISSLLGVSLDDPDVRLQLLLAFKADDIV